VGSLRERSPASFNPTRIALAIAPRDPPSPQGGGIANLPRVTDSICNEHKL
jgi:hypothetical protein